MTRRLIALVAAVLVALGCGESSNAGHSRPTELHGARMSGPTGLVLLVSANPPYLLDVDSGRVRRVTGLGARGRGAVISVLGVGRDAVVTADQDVYVVRHGATTATRIASGSAIRPAADGASVWVQREDDAHHCSLRRVTIAGRRLRSRPVSCSAPSAWATAGHFALSVGRPLQPLRLTDLRTGVRRSVRWPSRIGSDQAGADEAAVDPRGRLIAASFADPAYEFTAVQVIDVWVLDPRARRWQQQPGMPADVALKFTSMAWTGDGRLVMLAHTPSSSGHDVIAVWRPGEKRLALRSVRIPARDSGSDSFVAWRR